jgi:hypothetical protein
MNSSFKKIQENIAAKLREPQKVIQRKYGKY